MYAVYVDLKKAFDSMHRETFSYLLRFRGTPARIIGLLISLYFRTVNNVKCREGVSSFLLMNTKVRQDASLLEHLSTPTWTEY